jgi:hypothetical protein
MNTNILIGFGVPQMLQLLNPVKSCLHDDGEVYIQLRIGDGFLLWRTVCYAKALLAWLSVLELDKNDVWIHRQDFAC